MVVGSGMVVRSGMMVRMETGSTAALKPVTFEVAAPSVQPQFGRISILWIDPFFLFFTLINIFVTWH